MFLLVFNLLLSFTIHAKNEECKGTFCFDKIFIEAETQIKELPTKSIISKRCQVLNCFNVELQEE
jgi:hypothetical protein